MTLLLALFSLQAAWSFVQSPPRDVQRLYLDEIKTTEVWVLLRPEGPQGQPPLINLIFQAFFFGRATRDRSGHPEWPKGAPARLTLTAQALPLTAFSESWWIDPRREQVAFHLFIDGNSVDLTASGREHSYVGCPVTQNCTPVGVEAEIEPSLLQSLTTARTVRGHALGFPIELTDADQLALAAFVERINLSEKKGKK